MQIEVLKEFFSISGKKEIKSNSNQEKHYINRCFDCSLNTFLKNLIMLYVCYRKTVFWQPKKNAKFVPEIDILERKKRNLMCLRA